MEVGCIEEAGFMNPNEKDTVWFIVLPSSSIRIVSRTLYLNWVYTKPLSIWVAFPFLFHCHWCKYCIIWLWVSKWLPQQSTLLPLRNCRDWHFSLGKGDTTSKSWIKLFRVTIRVTHAKPSARHAIDVIPALLSFCKARVIVPVL